MKEKSLILTLALFMLIPFMNSYGQQQLQVTELKEPSLKTLKGTIKQLEKIKESWGEWGYLIIKLDCDDINIKITWNKSTEVFIQEKLVTIDDLEIGQKVTINYIEGEQVKIENFTPKKEFFQVAKEIIVSSKNQ